MKTQDGYRKKCKRFNINGHAHELTFTCYQNKPFLKSRMACSYLARAIERNAIKHKFRLWAYVFMPEHVHLLIFPIEPVYSISRILQSIKLSVSVRMINYLKKHQPQSLSYLETARKNKKYMFWQDGGGYDRNIFSRDALENSINYIHFNPVRKKLVDSPCQWYYSSYNQWIDKGDGPLKIDRTGIMS